MVFVFERLLPVAEPRKEKLALVLDQKENKEE
jgi:hypothetical protein